MVFRTGALPNQVTRYNQVAKKRCQDTILFLDGIPATISKFYYNNFELLLQLIKKC
jgi:hypothetical protein